VEEDGNRILVEETIVLVGVNNAIMTTAIWEETIIAQEEIAVASNAITTIAILVALHATTEMQAADLRKGINYFFQYVFSISNH
jgi:hypothetical protein